jgi:hypothetical protein
MVGGPSKENSAERFPRGRKEQQRDERLLGCGLGHWLIAAQNYAVSVSEFVRKVLAIAFCRRTDSKG